MKKLLFIACFIYGGLALAQQNEAIYFNKTYCGNDTCNMLCQVAYPISDGYLLMGGYSTDDFGHTLYISKTDKQGNLVWLKHLVQGSTWGVIEDGKWLCPTNDGNFVVTIVKAILPLGSGSTVHLFKFNADGDTLWHRIYENAHSQLIRHVIQTNDGGFALAGYRYYEGGVSDTARCLLIKTDEEGYIQWQKTYSMGNDARAFSVQQTPWDNGYIIGAWGYSTATGYDMFVVKTDSIGDTLWTKHYGGMYYDWGCQIVPLTTLAAYQSGEPITYSLTGAWRDTNNPWEAKLYIAKLNSIGGIIWQKKHANYSYFYNLQTFPIIRQGERLIGVGGFENYEGFQNPIIISFRSDGSIEWSKPITLDPTKSSYIKDMRPTADGGYVLAGYQYSTPQTAWVLKIDSLGNTCSFVGCDSTIYTGGFPIGLEEVLGKESGFKIAPNPAQDAVNIQLTYPSNEPLSVSICDISGRTMQTVLIQGRNTTISTQQLATGIYLCKLSNSNETQKLVIIR